MAPPDGELRFVPSLLLAATLTASCQSPSAAVQEPIQVAAASDLSNAFPELGKLFEARTGRKVTFSFAASGALAQQIAQGAPFDLFAAASASLVDDAVRAGACDGASKAPYARGHLSAWTKRGGPRLTSLADLLQAEIRHVAIANPEHAPYGRAARQALTRAGLWPELESKVVQADNVRQALQFAQTGNADVALVARSLVMDADDGRRLDIESSLHDPIEQALVLCRRGKNIEGARAFAALIESVDGQAVLQRYGFDGSAQELSK